MKNIQSYSNEVLLKETKSLVEKEREATMQLIECLEEVEVRMLYAKMGYSSLWQFCTEYLGLSEGAAQRRIAAMRLGRQVPEAKEALAEGKLSLSNASKLESFFANEKKNGRAQTMDQKRETIEKVEGMSQAACEKKLFEISPQFEVSQKEILKPISEDQNLLKLILDADVVAQLKLLKDRLAHKFPNASYAELIAYLIQDKLQQIEKRMEQKPESKSPEKPQREEPTAAAKVEARKAIPLNTSRALWKRSGGRCEYVAPDGKRCESAHALETDHVQVVARGGNNDLSNLRHVCRVHNGLFALDAFGSEWMEQFLPRTRREFVNAPR